MSSMATPFDSHKRKILQDLEVSPDTYTDKSPKGSVDANIVDLINVINSSKDYVTTSSCSGRISVYLEGEKSAHGVGKQVASRGGGKGGGGCFLFVSHDPLLLEDPVEERYIPKNQDQSFMTKFGLTRNTSAGGSMKLPSSSSRYIHFKFEPMILHVLAASVQSALAIVAAGQEAGFRESGVVGSPPLGEPKRENSRISANIRAAGLGFDSIIGYLDDQPTPSDCELQSVTSSHGRADTEKPKIAVVDEFYLRLLVQTANERFKLNEERIQRFRMFVTRKIELAEQRGASSGNSSACKNRTNWEDKATRAERKRSEGLSKQASLPKSRKTKDGMEADTIEVNGFDILESV